MNELDVQIDRATDGIFAVRSATDELIAAIPPAYRTKHVELCIQELRDSATSTRLYLGAAIVAIHEALFPRSEEVGR